jgi:hypothetical protein
MSAINADFVGYLQASLFNPLLYLTPLAGVLAAVGFCAFRSPNRVNRYVAAGLAGSVLVVGWLFFFTRGALPPRW